MKRSFVRTAVLLFALLLIPITAACGGRHRSSSEDLEIAIPDAAYDYSSTEALRVSPASRVAMVFMEPSSGYWEAVEEGASRAIEEINAREGFEGDDKVTLMIEAARDGSDIDDQINRIDALIAENPTVLCVAAIDAESCKAQIEAASDNRIPVIAMDSGLSNELVRTTCSTDNVAAGEEAARRLCTAIGDAGKVALVTHIETTQTAIARKQGADKCFKEHEDVEIVREIEMSEQLELEIQALLEANPDLKGILCTSEGTAETALRVLEKSGRTDVTLVGFDSGKQQIDAVKRGAELGMLSQNPRAIGYASVVASLRLAAGEPVDEQIDTGFCWIDKDNLDTKESAAYLYE